MHQTRGMPHSAGAPASGVRAMAHPRPGLSRGRRWYCRRQDTKPSYTATPEGTGRTSWPGGRWAVWHSTARQGAFPPLSHVDWATGAHPGLLHVGGPLATGGPAAHGQRPQQEAGTGVGQPPRTGVEPRPGGASTAAWQGDAIRATDVPDLHAGPITHARPAATLAVAQRGQQNPQWVVCMFSPGGRARRRLRP